jgi:Cu(I)/Ag(I) efflux system membrane protein CusA/SilA
MIERIIRASVEHRTMVLIATAMVVAAGAWSIRSIAIDAIPDLSDVQVIVLTEYPGQAPGVVEDQVTYPLSTAMLSVPFAKVVRGYSFFGFSMVYIIFEDGTDLYWARSRVLESLNYASRRLPKDVTPQLGPDATGVGWIYQYALSDFGARARLLRAQLDLDDSGEVSESELPSPAETISVGGSEVCGRELLGLCIDTVVEGAIERAVYSDEQLAALLPEPRAVGFLIDGFDRDRDGRISPLELIRAANFGGLDLAQLRSIQDWYLRYDLMSQPGVAEVASVGGFVRQYQVEVDPEKLRAFGVSLAVVRTAIVRANLDTGGRLLEMGETEFMVRGHGYIRSLEDLETIPVGLDAERHVPILLRQVARVQIGPDARRGVIDMNGEGEVVSGIVLLRFGGNALEVIERVEARLEELKHGMPEGVEVHVSYDRSKLIHRAISALRKKLLEEMAVVAIVCIIFLLHVRSALVAILTLPVGILAALIAMNLLGVNANIMSLGGIAIAIGVMVDASIVMVENLHKHREREPNRSQLELVLEASVEVGPALFFSLLIVTVSFLPVFSLQQQEGRLFTPLAYTKTFAMAASSVLAITLIPVLLFHLVRGQSRPESANPLTRMLIAGYRPVIGATLRHPRKVILGAVLIALLTVLPYSRLGSEFMPPLNEGDLLYMPTTPPGISITKAREVLQQTDRLIAMHPLVEHVLGKVGRAQTATDPAPLSMIETTITLRPESEWPDGKSIEDIVRELDAMVQLPGLTNAWTMPIKTRIDMLATGIKTPIGIKLLGEDLEVLSALGEQIEAILGPLAGTASVYSERVVGGNYVDIRIRRQDAARYGLNVADVQEVIATAIGGRNVTETVEGLERYPVNLRFPRELRNDIEALSRVAVPTPLHHTVPLADVADITISKGAPAIKSENARRTAWIYVDLNTSDIGGYVERARALLARELDLPVGVSMVWSGQYEYMERANERLRLVVPLTLGIIFLLLYLHFRSVSQSAMVLLGTITLAPLGGIWLLYALGFNLSIAVGVGFIALAGLAAENAVVMLAYLENGLDRARSDRGALDSESLRETIADAALQRVRPLVMTLATTLIGLLPIMYGTETGTRIMKRIAAPMVGGLISAGLFTLVVLPALYLLWHGSAAREPQVEGPDPQLDP